ncbi:MAG TPA: hypothetical protein PLV41_01780 [Miltoncostaeales bacterium]|nr:hypothetical protein [Miltoncostaeales bacterium]
MTVMKPGFHPPKQVATRWGLRILGVVVMVAGAALFYRFLSLGWADNSAFPDSSDTQRRALGLLGMPLAGIGLQLFLIGAAGPRIEPAETEGLQRGTREPMRSCEPDEQFWTACAICGMSNTGDHATTCATCAEVRA